RWWLGLFVITVIFGLVYLVLYPGLGNFKGVLGWTEHKQYQAQVAHAEQQFADFYSRFAGKSIPQLATSDEALGAGRNLFVNNCAACHGSDARGAPGFPNLTDNDWLYGGEPQTILATITNGRGGVMPALGPTLGEEKVNQVIAYVRSLSGNPEPADQVAAGKQVFAGICAACHGADARGNQAIGAPNLTDRTWLYGGSAAVIRKTLMQGRQGHMPAHKDLLGEHKIRLLAAYVWSLSHRETQAMDDDRDAHAED
ncbi:MAG: cytochrome-c oxidase, cbb3-type subunit III, partial [Gammaproteobacteria bacterium]